ncbi:hypothetical protein K474DRAFT_1680794 [Panus rudis PR-1116 ss-1]|nr:hypothetical protein K474DRAFT_1680794 [Panus rudis PR-1116 ss-1]
MMMVYHLCGQFGTPWLEDMCGDLQDAYKLRNLVYNMQDAQITFREACEALLRNYRPNGGIIFVWAADIFDHLVTHNTSFGIISPTCSKCGQTQPTKSLHSVLVRASCPALPDGNETPISDADLIASRFLHNATSYPCPECDSKVGVECTTFNRAPYIIGLLITFPESASELVVSGRVQFKVGEDVHKWQLFGEVWTYDDDVSVTVYYEPSPAMESSFVKDIGCRGATDDTVVELLYRRIT